MKTSQLEGDNEKQQVTCPVCYQNVTNSPENAKELKKNFISRNDFVHEQSHYITLQSP